MSQSWVAPEVTPNASRFWQLFASLWLVFLAFPLLSVLFDDDLSAGRKAVGVGLLVVFAVSYLQGAWVEDACTPRNRRTVVGFIIMVLAGIVGLAVAGIAMLGVVPFLTPYAVFSFRTRVAITVYISAVAFSFLVPLFTGELAQYWFFTLITFAVGAASALGKFGGEREASLFALQSQLSLTEERSRVARDVHDVLGHSLTAIVLKTQIAERHLASIENPSSAVLEAQAQIVETQEVTRRALSEIRETVDGLRVTGLAQEFAAAEQVLGDAGVELTVDGEIESIPEQYQSVIGWTVREAVTNIVRHANAHNCVIAMGKAGQLLTVRDDGVGRGASREGNGLSGLRERLETHELELLLAEANDGRGTLLSVGERATAQ